LSDDPSYVECCLSEFKNKIISKNSMGIDLAIMSLCGAGICSNSSFSWWGAYLMKDRKKVIMPKYWYGWKQKKESHVGIQPKWTEVIDIP
jgi:Glycosyl transferase family 11